MDAIFFGFLAAAGVFSTVLGALCYTPSDFDFIKVENGEIQ
ncbi:hypothetical protein [Williamsia sp.]